MALKARRRADADTPLWKQQLSHVVLEDSGRPRKRAKQEKKADDDDTLGSDGEEAATDREEAELVEDLFTLDSGWSVEVLGEDDSKLYDLEEPDSDDEAEELGMAARSILRSVPRHKLKELEAMQADAEEENAATKANARRRAAAEHKTHKQLRIVGGALAGRRILSGRGETTRPMMEKVRKALFDMLMSFAAGDAGFLEGTRWLDLFAGTGSVGLEALSRGAMHCHFIELDPWVINNVLSPNIEGCGMGDSTLIHSGKAEAFLQRARDAPHFASKPFDYISVCPPYLLVSYEELFELLSTSPLLHPGSVVFVEYPQSVSKIIPDILGPLALLRDRKYGRTNLAVYGPSAGEDC
ncbi:g4705 [Coccomyxa elongata]